MTTIKVYQRRIQRRRARGAPPCLKFYGCIFGNFDFITRYKNIGYAWRGIRTIFRPQKLYRARTAPPPVLKFLDPPLIYLLYNQNLQKQTLKKFQTGARARSADPGSAFGNFEQIIKKIMLDITGATSITCINSSPSVSRQLFQGISQYPRPPFKSMMHVITQF